MLFFLKDAIKLKSSIWAPGGTGSRIFGDNIANKAVSGKGSGKSAQEKLVNMQTKLQNKNLSNKKRKELKKHERKLRNDEKKRSDTAQDHHSHPHPEDPSELVVANVQALTI